MSSLDHCPEALSETHEPSEASPSLQSLTSLCWCPSSFVGSEHHQSTHRLFFFITCNFELILLNLFVLRNRLKCVVVQRRAFVNFQLRLRQFQNVQTFQASGDRIARCSNRVDTLCRNAFSLSSINASVNCAIARFSAALPSRIGGSRRGCFFGRCFQSRRVKERRRPQPGIVIPTIPVQSTMMWKDFAGSMKRDSCRNASVPSEMDERKSDPGMELRRGEDSGRGLICSIRSHMLWLRNVIQLLFAESQFPSMRSTRRCICGPLPKKLSPPRHGFSAHFCRCIQIARQVPATVVVTIWQILLITCRRFQRRVRHQGDVSYQTTVSSRRNNSTKSRSSRSPP